MNASAIINLIAIVVAPIAAVLIGQRLQNDAEKRKDKMQLFKTLMASRIYAWTPDSVYALNIIDIVFADDKQVRAAWKDLNDKLNVSNPDEHHLQKIQKSQYKLLEAIARSLGYKNKITWETIQNPYLPVGLTNQIEAQYRSQQEYYNVLSGMSKKIFETTVKESANNQDSDS